jgi:hypothetical protein
MKNTIASDLLPTVRSIETTPGAFMGLPPTLLSVRLVYMSLSSSIQRFLKMEYDIRLTAEPPSISILEIGFPSM